MRRNIFTILFILLGVVGTLRELKKTATRTSFNLPSTDLSMK